MWQLADVDNNISLNVSADDDGAMSGSLTVNGEQFGVSGTWAAASSLPNRHYSSFVLTGLSAGTDAHDRIAAAGIMDGNGVYPTSVTINLSIAPANSSTPINLEQQQLLPVANTDAQALANAYAESYMVLKIEPQGSALTCVSGRAGQFLSGTAGPIAPLGPDYLGGRQLTAEQCSAVCHPDSGNQDVTDIDVPAFTTDTGSKFVMVQIVGASDHYATPPLEEPHPHIRAIYYDTNVGALVLQFDDTGSTSQIEFNHPGHLHTRNHGSVIIRPN